MVNGNLTTNKIITRNNQCFFVNNQRPILYMETQIAKFEKKKGGDSNSELKYRGTDLVG